MFESLPNLPLERRWRSQLYPLAIVAALIERSHLDRDEVPSLRYLLIRRKKNPYAGLWALVGGKWDFGETLATAVIREVKEETGLETRYVALRGVLNERLAPSEGGNEAAHFLIFVCEVAAPLGEAAEQDEGVVAWFSLAEIDALHAAGQIISSDYTMLKQFAGATTAVPHFEVEMAVANHGDGDTGTAVVLTRFEEFRVDESEKTLIPC